MKITVRYANGEVKTYSQNEFVENFKRDETPFFDGEETPNSLSDSRMSGRDWAELVATKEAETFDDMVLDEAQTRFMVVEKKKERCGDTWETILEPGTTEAEAVAEAKKAWGNLCEKDKQNTIIELAIVEYDPVTETADLSSYETIAWEMCITKRA